MKTLFYKLLLLPALALAAASCNFLDVVPDERPTEADAFADFLAARRYLYSCYSYLPNPKEGAISLDLMTGDEVVTAFEHETFAKFCIGQFTASSPVISYWDRFFQGLRQCYTLLEKIDEVPGMASNDKEDYKAQVHFLIAYMHFLQVRCYGPCILVRELPRVDTEVEDYLGRSHLDECVKFICDEFDKAAAVLPDKRAIAFEYGLATSVAAKALKAKMLLYAASPLFNGGGPDGGGIQGYLSNFKDKNGAQLMPTSYDPAKWQAAKVALLEAIDAAHEAGRELVLYGDMWSEVNQHPKDPVVRGMRCNVLVPDNDEFIWSDSRPDNIYGIAVKSLPHVDQQAWNGVGPTLAMLKRFYTKNGLPIGEDPNFYTEDKYWTWDPNAEVDTMNWDGPILNFNRDREPRYYAWIAFQGGFFELLSAASKGAYDDDLTYQKFGPGRLKCDFVLGGNTSKQPNKEAPARVNDFSPSGFLNKKFVPPVIVVGTNEINLSVVRAAPWPIIRLADLYLMYAEACVEVNELETAEEYLDKVRVRAGIPTVQRSWREIKGAAVDQNILRSVVRQERQVELYLENQNFWDMRRWLLAADAFEGYAQGLNVDGSRLDVGETNESRFNKVVDARGSGGIHHFANPTHYFLPIPVNDVLRNPNITQNPGY